MWVVGRGEGVGHLGGERLGVLVMDEVLYEVLYGGMCGWNGCDVDVDVDVDVNSKEKINPFLSDLGRDGLRTRVRELLPWFQI